MVWPTALPWPIATIDFEASSLEWDSYPIEIGIALWPAPDSPILGWSGLIRPAGVWTRRGHWSVASATLHGIERDELFARGHGVVQVAAALNAVVGAGPAWCDGGAYDAHWTGALFHAAEAEPTFALGDWHGLLGMAGPEARSSALDWLARVPSQHQAGSDAERLLRALMHGVGAEAGPMQDLARHAPALNLLA